MRRTVIAVCAVVLALVGAAPGHAEKRVALVVGNDLYDNLPADQQLRRAANDARAVGDALDRLGFEVLRGENLGRQALVEKLDELTRRLSPGDTAFFFFAGHGVSMRGGNYILPTDVPNVQPGQETLLARTSLGENDIVSDLQGRGVRVAVVVLDACRNNPFKRPDTQAIGGERGCVRSDPVPGVFSLYSAGIGQTALDQLGDADTNPNSVFTRVLVPALGRPELDLGGLAIEVREEVARLAGTIGHIQHPAYYDGTIGGRIYLAGLPSAGTRAEGPTDLNDSRWPRPDLLVYPMGRGPVPTQGAAVVPSGVTKALDEDSRAADPSQAELAWAVTKDTTTIAVLEEFVRRYGNSPYAALARARMEELRKSPTTALAPPSSGSDTSAVPTNPNTAATAAVAQRVALYEEDPSDQQGKRFVGSAIWRTEMVPTGPRSPPDLAVRADIEIPERRITMTLLIRRDLNQVQQATSHTIEITFNLPADFPFGGIQNVPGVLMKQAEQTRGSPLGGAAAKVSSGYFLIGLSAVETDMQRNVQLLKERNWFDIPIVYNNGRRAILAIEKGTAGERALEEALNAWGQNKPFQDRVGAAPTPVQVVPREEQPVPLPTGPTPAPREAGGAYVVQVSAQKTEDEARASYQTLQQKYPSVFGGREANIRRADLRDKGVYYWAQIGPFQTVDEANAFCGDLKAAGGQCIVQKNASAEQAKEVPRAETPPPRAKPKEAKPRRASVERARSKPALASRQAKSRGSVGRCFVLGGRSFCE